MVIIAPSEIGLDSFLSAPDHSSPYTAHSKNRTFDILGGNGPKVNIINPIARIRKDSVNQQFYAQISLNINDKPFQIIISGNINMIEGTDHIIRGRKHPFNTKNSSGEINFLRTVGRRDIQEGMNLALLYEGQLVNTSLDFFEKLRKFIPANHPLSTLPEL